MGPILRQLYPVHTIVVEYLMQLDVTVMNAFSWDVVSSLTEIVV
jgi:hypothetical protein